MTIDLTSARAITAKARHGLAWGTATNVCSIAQQPVVGEVMGEAGGMDQR